MRSLTGVQTTWDRRKSACLRGRRSAHKTKKRKLSCQNLRRDSFGSRSERLSRTHVMMAHRLPQTSGFVRLIRSDCKIDLRTPPHLGGSLFVSARQDRQVRAARLHRLNVRRRIRIGSFFCGLGAVRACVGAPLFVLSRVTLEKILRRNGRSRNKDEWLRRGSYIRFRRVGPPIKLEFEERGAYLVVGVLRKCERGRGCRVICVDSPPHGCVVFFESREAAWPGFFFTFAYSFGHDG